MVCFVAFQGIFYEYPTNILSQIPYEKYFVLKTWTWIFYVGLLWIIIGSGFWGSGFWENAVTHMEN